MTRNATLRPGQVLRVPEPGTHYVSSGETLASIAKDHSCSVRELVQLNRLRPGRPLQIGQRLILPGYQAARERERAAKRWGRPRNPGVATLHRRALDRTVRIRLVDNRGRARPAAIRQLRELMRPRNEPPGPPPPRRLIEILARISDHFGGRTITIVSGYREAGGFTRESSRHTRGHALDIRVQGVPPHEVRDFVRSAFSQVGVGYYPRSRFVHIDVRDRDAYWVDWAGPGEGPRYQRRGEPAPADATAEEIARTGMGGHRSGSVGTATAEEDSSRARDGTPRAESGD